MTDKASGALQSAVLTKQRRLTVEGVVRDFVVKLPLRQCPSNMSLFSFISFVALTSKLSAAMCQLIAMCA